MAIACNLETIAEAKADYVIQVKNNQKNLHENIFGI